MCFPYLLLEYRARYIACTGSGRTTMAASHRAWAGGTTPSWFTEPGRDSSRSVAPTWLSDMAARALLFTRVRVPCRSSAAGRSRVQLCSCFFGLEGRGGDAGASQCRCPRRGSWLGSVELTRARRPTSRGSGYRYIVLKLCRFSICCRLSV